MRALLFEALREPVAVTTTEVMTPTDTDIRIERTEVLCDG